MHVKVASGLCFVLCVKHLTYSVGIVFCLYLAIVSFNLNKFLWKGKITPVYWSV